MRWARKHDLRFSPKFATHRRLLALREISPFFDVVIWTVDDECDLVHVPVTWCDIGAIFKLEHELFWVVAQRQDHPRLNYAWRSSA